MRFNFKSLLKGFVCGGLVAVGWELFFGHFKIPAEKDRQLLKPVGLVGSRASGETNSLKHMIRGSVPPDTSRAQMFQKLSERSVTDIAELISESRTIGRERMLWKGCLEHLAGTDSEKALKLAQMAPRWVRADYILVESAVRDKSLERMGAYTAAPISKTVVAKGLAQLFNNGSDPNVLKVLGSLVDQKGKLGNQERRAIIRALGDPPNRDVVKQLLSPELWSPGINLEGLIDPLKRSGADYDEIESLLLPLADGNSTLLSKALASLHSRAGKAAAIAGNEIPEPASLFSRAQSERTVKNYALGVHEIAPGIEALTWAFNLPDPKRSKVSEEAIILERTKTPQSRETFIKSLNESIGSDSHSHSQAAESAVRWITRASKEDPGLYKTLMEIVDRENFGSLRGRISNAIDK